MLLFTEKEMLFADGRLQSKAEIVVRLATGGGRHFGIQAQILVRIDRRAMNPNFVVKVRPGDAACAAAEGNHFALTDFLARNYEVLRKVSVLRL